MSILFGNPQQRCLALTFFEQKDQSFVQYLYIKDLIAELTERNYILGMQRHQDGDGESPLYMPLPENNEIVKHVIAINETIEFDNKFNKLKENLNNLKSEDKEKLLSHLNDILRFDNIGECNNIIINEFIIIARSINLLKSCFLKNADVRLFYMTAEEIHNIVYTIDKDNLLKRYEFLDVETIDMIIASFCSLYPQRYTHTVDVMFFANSQAFRNASDSV